MIEQLAQLREPFKPGQVGKLPKVTCPNCSAKDRQCTEHKRQTCRTCKAYVSTKHIHIDYVGHAHVTERLLDVDPEWSWEPVAFNGNGLPALDDNNGLWISLTVSGVTRLGYGHASGKRGGDAIKETIGDAIRNAAMRFGVALDLWKKEAPEPAAEMPERQAAKHVPPDRAVELRAQIAAVGKAKAKTLAEIGDDFASWSRGQDITKASVPVLAEYLDHIRRPE